MLSAIRIKLLFNVAYSGIFTTWKYIVKEWQTACCLGKCFTTYIPPNVLCVSNIYLCWKASFYFYHSNKYYIPVITFITCNTSLSFVISYQRMRFTLFLRFCSFYKITDFGSLSPRVFFTSVINKLPRILTILGCNYIFGSIKGLQIFFGYIFLMKLLVIWMKNWEIRFIVI